MSSIGYDSASIASLTLMKIRVQILTGMEMSEPKGQRKNISLTMMNLWFTVKDAMLAES
jgi:hypothetical protein